MSRPTKHETREAWLEDAANYLFTDYIGELGRMEKGHSYQISCGWPSTRSQSTAHRRLGECWAAKACADKSTYHIFISPVLDSPVEILPILLHELVHAVCGVEVGHKGPFKRLALALGLEGKMTETHAGKELTRRLNTLVRVLGPYPHKALTGPNSRKKQSTRLLKLEAKKCCGYIVRTTQKWLDEEGLPKCPHNSELAQS